MSDSRRSSSSERPTSAQPRLNVTTFSIREPTTRFSQATTAAASSPGGLSPAHPQDRRPSVVSFLPGQPGQRLSSDDQRRFSAASGGVHRVPSRGQRGIRFPTNDRRPSAISATTARSAGSDNPVTNVLSGATAHYAMPTELSTLDQRASEERRQLSSEHRAAATAEGRSFAAQRRPRSEIRSYVNLQFARHLDLAHRNLYIVAMEEAYDAYAVAVTIDQPTRKRISLRKFFGWRRR